jgi:putative colanic acid biosynthesis UDP-glucose lipid carrier transferase
MATGYYKLGFALMLVAALESIVAPLISTVTLVACTQMLGIAFSQPYMLLAIFSALLSYMLIRPETKQHGFIFPSGWTIATRTGFAWISVVGLLLLIAYATKVSQVYSRAALFLWFAATPPLLIAASILLRHGLRHLTVASGKARAVVFAGANDMSRELARTIADRPELGLWYKGFFEDRCPHRIGTEGSFPLLGTLNDLPEYVKRHHIDVIFIAMPHHLDRTKALLHGLRDTTASVYLIPEISFIDLIQSRADEISGIPVIALCETPFQGWTGFKKRAADVMFSTLMLLVALPAMIFIAVGVKTTTPGSVIFRQRRYGLDGEEIIVYKFRTMTVTEDGDAVRQATRDDPRVTRFGRFLRRYSLDELPQLVNVLQGRMSLVGPRPHAIAHNEEYRKLIDGYMVRHKVSPGITGLAQVNGCRGETTSLAEMKRRIDYDLDYLRHWSFMLDLKILCKTIAILFRGERAY